MFKMSNSVSTEAPSSSIRTDLTVTSHGHSDESSLILDGRDKYMHHLVEKLQLEVNERDAKIIALIAQNEESVSRIELQKNSECGEKKIKVHLLETELFSTQEELRLIKERTAKELANLLQKCTQFQKAQGHINVTQEEAKSELDNLYISEEEYFNLKNIPRAQLNLKEFSSLRLHEIVVPLKAKINELSSTKSSITSALNARESQLHEEQDERGRMEKRINQLTEKILSYEQTCKELRENSKTDDFRVINFNRMKQERDKLEEDNYQLLKLKSSLESKVGTLRKEKETFENKLIDSHQKSLRLEQDYIRYKNDASEDTKQLNRTKDELRCAQRSLTLERDKMDDLHNKYLKSRTDNISLTDSNCELENKTKTLTEKYERAAQNEAKFEEKYFQTLRNYEDASRDLDNLKHKTTKENDALSFQLHETKQSLEIISRGNEANKMELALVKEQLDKTELDLNYERRKYDNDLALLTKELRQYRLLEGEYKASITAIAAHPEKERSSTIISGKLSEEAIDLTRRVLQLERHNMQACDTVRKLTSGLDQTKRQIKAYKRAVTMAGKPSSELLETIAAQEDQILSLEEALVAVREAMRRSETDLGNLKVKYNEVTGEFKNLLEEKNDLSDVKEEVVRLSKAYHQEQRLPSAIRISKESR